MQSTFEYGWRYKYKEANHQQRGDKALDSNQLLCAWGCCGVPTDKTARCYTLFYFTVQFNPQKYTSTKKCTENNRLKGSAKL